MATRLSIMAVRFRRTSEDPWETGVIVNENKLIIDMNGHSVEHSIYNYLTRPELGTLILIDEE